MAVYPLPHAVDELRMLTHRLGMLTERSALSVARIAAIAPPQWWGPARLAFDIAHGTAVSRLQQAAIAASEAFYAARSATSAAEVIAAQAAAQAAAGET